MDGLLRKWELFLVQTSAFAVRKMKMKVGAQMQTSAAKYAFEVMNEIRQNYQKEISVTYMAKRIGVSRTHLSHCFKLIYQKSIQDYITSYRMEKAQELLIHTQKKIKEIAFFGWL